MRENFFSPTNWNSFRLSILNMWLKGRWTDGQMGTFQRRKSVEVKDRGSTDSFVYFSSFIRSSSAHILTLITDLFSIPHTNLNSVFLSLFPRISITFQNTQFIFTLLAPKFAMI